MFLTSEVPSARLGLLRRFATGRGDVAGEGLAGPKMVGIKLLKY